MKEILGMIFSFKQMTLMEIMKEKKEMKMKILEMKSFQEENIMIQMNILIMKMKNFKIDLKQNQG